MTPTPAEPPPRDEPTADTRERLLAAAADHFRQPEYGILSDVAVSAIARRAGVSEATARRYFLVEELHTELIRYLLRPGRDPSARGFGGQGWDGETIREAIRRVNAPGVRLDDGLREIMDWLWPGNIDDPQLRSQMALGAYASGNPVIARELTELNHWYEDGIRRIMIDIVARRSGSVHIRRDWISLDDFALAVNIIAEGLAIRADLHQADGGTGYGFDPHLGGRILVALVGSMLQLHDDDEHPLNVMFQHMDPARSAPPSDH
ncbi:MAG: TetR/AcrR family transcriptional regulator [Acidimicrobiales bacterium]